MLLCQALLGGNAAKVPISSQDGRCFLKPENNMEFHVCSAAETWCVSVHLPAHVLMTSGLITE